MGTEVNKKFIQTIYLPGSELEKLGLKTGDGLDDIALYKEIPKQFLCDDIAEKAALSTYFNVRKLIEKYEGENILFIWDEESVVSDDNFYFCINEEYKRDRLTYFMSSGVSAEKVSQTEEEKEAARKAKEEEDERLADEEKIARLIEELKSTSRGFRHHVEPNNTSPSTVQSKKEGGDDKDGGP